jgi:putative FmdB family regulatory protein
MPTYEFSCARCGAFEQWRDAGRAGEPCACPACGEPARRAFAFAARAPRAAGLLSWVSAEGRDRIIRAHTGEPRIVEGPPAGTRVTGGLTGPVHVHNRPHHPSRPWQVGHC